MLQVVSIVIVVVHSRVLGLVEVAHGTVMDATERWTTMSVMEATTVTSMII